METAYRKLSLALLLVLSSTTVSAGGPTNIAGIDGNTAVRYPDSSIILNVENGDLGSTSNAAAIILLQGALDLWNTVSTSNLNLSIDQTQIALDIDVNNVQTYLPKLDDSEFNANDNLNPVVFDSDGSIIDLYLGALQSETVLGFAQSVFDVSNGIYLEGFAVINGTIDTTDTELKLTIAHELGHFFGLDHSQLNINNEESFADLPLFCFTTAWDNYPLMYPVACRNVESLHADDISTVSALYPETNLNDSYGILEGRFLDESGNAILGANIWAENINSGEIVSIVSDYLKQNTGFYRLYLPAGSYTLHANSINTLFFAGSGVGPYSSSESDASFIAPHPLSLVTYHGLDGIEDETITIALNQTTTIDFSSIGKQVVPVSNSDSDGGFADLLGASSPVALLFLLVPLVTGRLRSRRSIADYFR